MFVDARHNALGIAEECINASSLRPKPNLRFYGFATAGQILARDSLKTATIPLEIDSVPGFELFTTLPPVPFLRSGFVPAPKLAVGGIQMAIRKVELFIF